MSDNRRQNFRIQHQEDQPVAVLFVGRRKFPCRIVDQSASGYRVAVEKKLSLKEGQVLRLVTTSGGQEVLVRRITDEEFGTTLGLQRLSEEADPVALARLRVKRPQFIGTFSASKGAAVFGLLLTCVVGVICFSSGNSLKGALGAARSTVSSAVPLEIEQTRTAGFFTMISASLPFGNKEANQRRAAAEKEFVSIVAKARDVEKEIVGTVNQYTSLANVDTAKQLGLSFDQQLKLRQLLDDSTVALAQLHCELAVTSPSEWTKQSTKAADELNAKIRSLLTPEQLSLWEQAKDSL